MQFHIMTYLLSTASGNSSVIAIGLCVASGGLLLGMAAGRLFRTKSEYQGDDESVDLHAANAPADGLAGLSTRRAFDAEFRRRLDDFQRAGAPFCLLLIDIDHFKEFNDIHDHLAGEEILRMIGRIVKSTTRSADFLARYSGEEFALLMPDTHIAQAMDYARRIRAAIEQEMFGFGGRKLKVTASIGVAEAAPGQTSTDHIRFACEALATAKQAGCNQVQQYRTPNERNMADAKSAASFRSHQQGLPTPSRQAFSPLTASKMPRVETRTDAQTGLPNITAFREEIHRRLSEAQRHGNRVSVLLVKIDNLAGLLKMRPASDADLILRSCAQFFTAALRDMDLIVRYDVDEFGVMLPGTSLANAAGVGHRLRTTIQQCPLRLRDDEIHFTLSAGVAEAQPSEDLASLLKRATETKNSA
ncbi:MAG TPA: GGDEF domain-containing protein, partial [Pirellulales bacterium]